MERQQEILFMRRIESSSKRVLRRYESLLEAKLFKMEDEGKVVPERLVSRYGLVTMTLRKGVK